MRKHVMIPPHPAFGHPPRVKLGEGESKNRFQGPKFLM